MEYSTVRDIRSFSKEEVWNHDLGGSRKALLDINVRNVPKFRLLESWSKKQRRAYHRLLSGIKRCESLGFQLRFLTLTSSPSSDWRSINSHFQVLRKRIQRKFGWKMEYWKIRTNEGHGVFHVLFKGGYLPQRWLSAVWSEIHGAKVVDIRQFRFGSRRLAGYLISNYLAKQTFERMSWSWGWVFKAFVGRWHWLVLKMGFVRALVRWNWILTQPIMFWQDAKLGLSSIRLV